MTKMLVKFYWHDAAPHQAWLRYYIVFSNFQHIHISENFFEHRFMASNLY